MNKNVKWLTGTALMTAVLCVLGPLSLPIGPVPVSLTSFVIYLFLYILETKQAMAAFGIYLLLGFAGLPVFSGFTGGAAKLLGPTGGYLIGFFPLILLGGTALRRIRDNRVRYSRIMEIVSLEAATWILYMMGTAWLAISAHMSFGAALAAGVIPFILIDLVKIVISAVIGPVLSARIRRAVSGS